MPIPRLGRSRFSRALAASALLIPALAACRGTIPIERLLDDPSRYEGETVRVEGRVTSAFGALGRGAYRLDDGTGTLNVVSGRGGAPREGAEVGVEGEFRSLFTFGDQTGAYLLEEDRFDP